MLRHAATIGCAATGLAAALCAGGAAGAGNGRNCAAHSKTISLIRAAACAFAPA
jgi:hypothetical protein